MSDLSVRSSETAFNVNSVGKVATISQELPPQFKQPIPYEKVKTTKELKAGVLKGEGYLVGEDYIVKAIEKANKALTGATTTFEFSIHEQTKQIMVKVMDKDTGELIRELPPEKVLDMVAHLWEMAGIIVDERR